MNFIFGSSGFAKEVDWLLSDLYIYNRIDYSASFFVCEDNSNCIGNVLNEKEIISERNFIDNYITKDTKCFIAVGSPQIRKKIFDKLYNEKNIFFPTLIHPNVSFDSRKGKISIGNGSIICSRSILTTDIKIDDFVHINLACTIGHDSMIGSFSTLSPGTHISGGVRIGKNVFIGTGAIILENISICDNTIIGAGSVIVKNIVDSGTYIGIPAKKIK